MYKGQRITVCMPALNEAAAIDEVIAAVMDVAVGDQVVVDEIIVCDNGSEDATAECASSAGARVVYEPQRGYGAACLKAVAAIGETDVVVFMNSDGSENPCEIICLLDGILAGNALVVGNRVASMLQPGAVLPHQRLGTRVACSLMALIWQQPVCDLGPFRAIRFRALQFLQMQDRDYGWTIEMQLKAITRGLLVENVPVSALKGRTPSVIAGTFLGSLSACYKLFSLILWYSGIEIYRLYLRETEVYRNETM